MSLSTAGTINTVTISFNDIVKDALQDLRVLLDGGTPTAGDVSDAQRKVNFLLKKWAIKGLLLWCRDTIPIPMVTNIFKYTIGPGGDVDTYRPLRALEGTFIRQTCGQQPAPDVPMTLLAPRLRAHEPEGDHWGAELLLLRSADGTFPVHGL